MVSPGCFNCLLFVLCLSLFVFVDVFLFLFDLCHHFVAVVLFQGVVAGGVGCGLANYPGVYVRWVVSCLLSDMYILVDQTNEFSLVSFN